MSCSEIHSRCGRYMVKRGRGLRWMLIDKTVGRSLITFDSRSSALDTMDEYEARQLSSPTSATPDPAESTTPQAEEGR